MTYAEAILKRDLAMRHARIYRERVRAGYWRGTEPESLPVVLWVDMARRMNRAAMEAKR